MNMNRAPLLLELLLVSLALLATPFHAAAADTAGFIVYNRGSDIWSMNADGTAQTPVRQTLGFNEITPAISPDGQKIAFASDQGGAGWDIWVMNSDGTNPVRLTAGGQNLNPAWSPDGTQIAFDSFRGGRVVEIWAMDADGQNQRRVTNPFLCSDQDPEWSPDGSRVAFYSNCGVGGINIASATDGSARTFLAGGGACCPTWSPLGNLIGFRRQAAEDMFDAEIYLVEIDTQSLINVTREPGFDTQPSFSPDGAQIVYSRNVSGNWELYSINVDGTGRQNLTVNAPGFHEIEPDWGPAPFVNQRPVAEAGPDQEVRENSPVTLSGAMSFDPDGDELTFEWVQSAGDYVVALDYLTASDAIFTAPLLPGGVGAAATLVFTLTVSDGTLSSSDEIIVTVTQDNHPPEADAGPAQTVNAGTLVMLDGSASSDPDSDALHFHWVQIGTPTVALMHTETATPRFTAPSVMGPTALTFRLVVEDGELTSAPAEVVITVVRPNDPPQCTLARAVPNLLWAPNHRLVEVELTGLSDPDDDAVAVTITGVTQDEPVNGLGDGDTGPDAVVQGATVLLRAERAGGSNGRVYQIHFNAVDEHGAACAGSATVVVPDSMKGESIIDDGQLYDSTQP